MFKSVFRRVLDWLSVYVPVFLMGLLALGSYVLVRNTPSVSQPTLEAMPRHVPDYFMKQFSVRSYEPDGKLKSEVFGTALRHYPDTDTTEIDDARIRVTNKGGLVSVSTAKRALSNADGSEVQLSGNVVVVREAGVNGAGAAQERLEFRGEFIHTFMNTDQLRSHLPVVLIRGKDRFAGDTFTYDHLEGVAELQGRVSGQIGAKRR